MSKQIREQIEKVKNWKLLLNESKDFSEKEIDIIFNNTKKYISENNKIDNHYHNNKHILDVFNNSMMLFNEYKKEYKLKPINKLCLGLAALFHDYNHSGGKLKDDENIEVALEELKKYLKIINKSDLFNNIKKIIIVTEYPHKDLDLDILEKIIRDADTMGGIVDDWISVVKSLAKEYNKELKDFIPIQIKFIENVKYNTDYCNKLLKDNKKEIIKKLKKML
jgi:predicted metal-dependent HD superfamily phosphohydrolase